ncbi:MAG: DUF4837 family protein [Gemmatimonadota bacterium]|jgi:hypothetical protein
MRSVFSILVLVGLAGTGCEAARRTTLAHGEESSIIILAADSVWAQVEDSVLATLEPRTFTVRDEKMFVATWTSPFSEDWITLRTFRQVLTIGVAGDGWVAPALDDSVPTPPAVVETPDVWARDQLVTAVVLPPQNSAAALMTLLPGLAARFDARFRAYVQQRMFMSDVNTELRDSLRAEAGFSLLLPNIYRAYPKDSIWVFRNRAEVGSELYRTIIVASRPGVLRSANVDTVLAWRDRITPLVFEPQLTERERVETKPLPEEGEGAMQVQGIWRGADPTLPSAGPFVDRIVPCPAADRTYYLEGWLYAPARRKYEYMIQLETLLDSFECSPFTG